MTNAEIIALLRQGVPPRRIAEIPGVTYHRARRLQATYCPDTRKPRGRPLVKKVKAHAGKSLIHAPVSWDGRWVEVSRETDASGNVVSMKVEVSDDDE